MTGLRDVAALAGGALLALAAGWPADAPADMVTTAPELASAWVEQHAWWLSAVGLWLAWWALSAAGASLRRSGLRAAGLALVWQGGGLWWLYIGLHKYAGLSAGLTVAALTALMLYLSAYSVLAMAAWARWFGPQRRGLLASAAAFAACWLLAELGRAAVFTGFPWAATGYAHLHGPWRPLAPWLGVYGVGAVTAFGVALVAGGLGAVLAVGGTPAGRKGRGAVAAGLVLALAGLSLYGQTRGPLPEFSREAGEMDARLLQGNVSQEGKFDPARNGQIVGWHLRALQQSDADLTLTPETALPVLVDALPPEVWARLRERVQSEPGVLLFGVAEGGAGQPQYNSLLGMGRPDSLLQAPADGVYRYHKAHLVPFGEFTPPGFAWFTRLLDLPMPAFSSGGAPPRPLVLRTRGGTVQRIAPLVCFEDLFGEELARRFRDPAQAPTVLSNSSNLAWFDDSSAIAQHLRIARYRSLEFERPTLRATNTGATALIDHHGDLVRALPLNTVGVLGVVAQGREGLTPYAWWASRWGLWPLLGLALLLLGGAALAGRQARRGPSSRNSARRSVR